MSMVYPLRAAKRIMSFRAAQGGTKLARVFTPAARGYMWDKL